MMVDTGGRVPVILLIVSIAVAGGEVFAQRPTGCSVGDAGIHTTATGSVADSHGHAAGGGVASGGVASGGVAYVDAGSGAVASVQQAGKELHVTSLSPSTGWRTANGTVEGQVVRVDFANTTLEGRLGPQCDRIHWNNGVTWFRRYEDIRTVDVVFMTHLDVGFTNLARNVCDTYFTEHIPKAIETALALRNGSVPDTDARFVYTSHPWLLQEYLDNAVQCAHRGRTPEEVGALTAAIKRGDVKWHGKPMNLLVELSDAALFSAGLDMAHTLNANTGQQWGTVTAKSTDVPGLSISTVPLLAAKGLKAVHIGYNGACLVPDVPPLFVWRHEASSTELVVMVESGYGEQIIAENASRALVLDYTLDNGSPPNATQVATTWANIKLRFPNATVQASSLDDFGRAVSSVKESLPVITSEIGQSWSYGAPAAAFKMAGFRELRRATLQAIADGRLSADDPSLLAYQRRIMKAPEHNFGLSIGQYLPQARQQGNWTNAEFESLRSSPGYAFVESGWFESRSFLWPVQRWLPSATAPPSSQWSAFEVELRERLAALVPAPPQVAGFTPIASGTFSVGPLKVTLRSTDGAITSLVDSRLSQARDWASSSHPMAALTYQTFSMDDFNEFNQQYNPFCGSPCGDFSKGGMATAKPVAGVYSPTMSQLYSRVDAGSTTFLAQLHFADELHTKYGAPGVTWLNVTISPGSAAGQASLAVTVAWFNKTATRLAEAMHLSLSPVVADPTLWRADVLGRPINPLDVVVNGTQHLHAVWPGVGYTAGQSAPDAGTSVVIDSLDAPLVQPGGAAGDNLLRYDGETKPDMSGGWHWNLYNNVWGTAFPQWYDDDAAFRFTVALQAA